MPKEYVVIIETDDEQMKDIVYAIRHPESPDEEYADERGKMRKVEAREEVLRTIVYGIQTQVRGFSFAIFTGSGKIGLKHVQRKKDVKIMRKSNAAAAAKALRERFSVKESYKVGGSKKGQMVYRNYYAVR